MALPPAPLLLSQLFVLHSLRQMFLPLFPDLDQASAAGKQPTPDQAPRPAPRRQPPPPPDFEPPVQYQNRLPALDLQLNVLFLLSAASSFNAETSAVFLAESLSTLDLLVFGSFFFLSFLAIFNQSENTESKKRHD
jgi:hypothetical protein